jgi:hypothetical protein
VEQGAKVPKVELCSFILSSGNHCLVECASGGSDCLVECPSGEHINIFTMHTSSIVYPLINYSIIEICRCFFIENKVNGGDWQTIVQKEPRARLSWLWWKTRHLGQT